MTIRPRTPAPLGTAALLGAVLLTAPGTATAADVDFTGAVALSNCSGAVVRAPASAPSDPALVMTNGHCVRMLAADEVLVDQHASRTFALLSPSGNDELAVLRATRLEYATSTGTDLALYRTDTTYARIEELGTRALPLSRTPPPVGADVRVVSGYWKRVYSCSVDAVVHELREGDWTWRDSIRYTESCDTIGGTSGSPVVDAVSGEVVGVNNTTNENGERCTQDNPCEVDEAGSVVVREGARYGQQTHMLAACVGGGGRVVLTLPGCDLPRPAEVAVS
ncbi:S1 family peptidase [Umezawaea beigongshangensis]|uniref:S1 family peptidase n=1 Tax=Umezawaea beigongshangensis TaxID=2780383 RepID=UPI0027DBAD32|nr:serine protease [Umezawaea beigongshangensis]